MKTFIASLIIFALLCALVFCASFFIKERTGALLELAAALPETAEGFARAQNLREETRKLCELWAQSMEIFPYIMNYDMLDRADDAMLSLSAAAEAESAENFLSALFHFKDAVLRLSSLFALSPKSVL